MTDTKATPKEGSVHPCCGKHFCSCTLEEIFAAFRRCEDRGLEAVRERDTWKELAQSAERRLSDSQKRPTLVCGTCGGNDRPDCEGDVKHAQDCAFGGELTNLHDAIQSMTDELSECNRAIPDTPEFDFLAGKTLPECVEALVNSFSEGTPRWIPVSERLPEFPESSIKSSGNSVKVIVFTGYFVTALDYARNVYAKTAKGQAPRFEWEGRISPWPVTHWMPLPEGPSK